MPRKLYIETYGCQMNVADSQLIAGELEALEFELTESPAEADVVLVNTCAIRENAETRVWGRLAQLAEHKRHRPGQTLGVVGCMAQHLRDHIQTKAPYVDLVVGPDAYRRLGDILLTERDAPYVDVAFNRSEVYEGLDPRSDNGLTAFVTVERGCDKFCTFCIVPYVRGRERSVPLDEVLRGTRVLVEQGVREVTLLGQTVNAWRQDDLHFGDLLRAVATIDGLERIRFTSPHPAEFTPAIIDALASTPKVMPAVHLPLQSASDSVLERMNRGHTYAAYQALVADLRAAIPDLCLTTDLLVGFVGETEDDFAQTMAAVDELRFDAAFMFAYSARSGTRAHDWDDDVPQAEKLRRLELLIARQEAISAEVNAARHGAREEVLVEGPAKRGDGWWGRSRGFKNTVFSTDRTPTLGELVWVEVDNSTAHTLLGREVAVVDAALV
ncbi:MAG TPA: tRNA (N6-isopentenyl adenosine(37)-C2)-methylthiotransferase MiaB [Armatimonadetes bacterium]|nr:tRNA (N6-isopentenyl adenosine(37)-C2)-methylthiotransferase MiaB [Armatimonadota bacterium]